MTYRWDEIAWCETNRRCLVHPGRPQVEPPFGPMPHGFHSRNTLSCSECWPKKVARKRAKYRRDQRQSANPRVAEDYATYTCNREAWQIVWDVSTTNGGFHDLACCAYCQRLVGSRLFGRNANLPTFTTDHVEPVARGGSDEWTNKVPSCIWCNTSKGSKRIWSEWTPRNPSQQLLVRFPPEGLP